MKTKVRTTQEEIAKYRKIRAIMRDAEEVCENAYTLLKAAYKAENRLMHCDPTNDTPERIAAFFAPKSPAIAALTRRYDAARASYRRVQLMLGGAKVINRLHHLEQAGVLDA